MASDPTPALERSRFAPPTDDLESEILRILREEGRLDVVQIWRCLHAATAFSPTVEALTETLVDMGCRGLLREFARKKGSAFEVVK